MVPHDLEDLWDGVESSAPRAERLAIGFELYGVMPCYHNAFILYQAAYEEPDREEYWTRVRDWVDAPQDALADPQMYALWADWFEDERVVAEAWYEIARRPARLEPRRTRRLLRACGPVPWTLKAPLLERLLGEPGWDADVLQALAGSAFEIYGQIEVDHARDMLARLRVADDAPNLAELRERLAS